MVNAGHFAADPMSFVVGWDGEKMEAEDGDTEEAMEGMPGVWEM